MNCEGKTLIIMVLSVFIFIASFFSTYLNIISIGILVASIYALITNVTGNKPQANGLKNTNYIKQAKNATIAIVVMSFILIGIQIFGVISILMMKSKIKNWFQGVNKDDYVMDDSDMCTIRYNYICVILLFNFFFLIIFIHLGFDNLRCFDVRIKRSLL